jgi:hypothetical protein
MIRTRFKVNPEDPRPVHWPIKHPYWVTGEAGDGSYAIIVAYANDLAEIARNWPDAFDIESEHRDEYLFTGRFPKPEWFTEPAQPAGEQASQE